MPDIDLALILANGEYLRRVGDTLDGAIPDVGVDSVTITTIWSGTTAAYTALGTYNANTLYFLT